MKPLYFPEYIKDIKLKDILDEVSWIQVTESRLESFQSFSKETYTYGSGKGIRTYTPGPYTNTVLAIQKLLNGEDLDYNVCFLNRYDTSQMQLGWHADNSPGMNHNHPIAVVSLGQAREIWWRENDAKGVVPEENRQLLGNGSLFVMPAGMQITHQHRIPKGDREMSTRISMTFRNYIPS